MKEAIVNKTNTGLFVLPVTHDAVGALERMGASNDPSTLLWAIADLWEGHLQHALARLRHAGWGADEIIFMAGAPSGFGPLTSPHHQATPADLPAGFADYLCRQDGGPLSPEEEAAVSRVRELVPTLDDVWEALAMVVDYCWTVPATVTYVRRFFGRENES